jgi:hypothetical protein
VDHRDAVPSTAVTLSWLPLGAGGHVVRWNGLLYEALVAARERRPRRDLYHGALTVRLDGDRYVVELAPAADPRGGGPGVVMTGPVGLAWAGRLRWFRYELRCWRDGVLPDQAHAVGDPALLSTDDDVARRLLAAAPHLPPLVWGRDAARTGEMWNSNSALAWLLERAGLDADAVRPPPGGRAPGWRAGVVLARSRAGSRPGRSGRATTTSRGPACAPTTSSPPTTPAVRGRAGPPTSASGSATR